MNKIQKSKVLFIVVNKILLFLYENRMNLSSYILTCNSERYLEEILVQLDKFSDEIVILDSGSTDSTLNIAQRFEKCKIHYRPFDNFKNQRNHASSLCQYDAVFFVDSDEIPDEALVKTLKDLKQSIETIGEEAYFVKRYWQVLGTPVHAIYPVESPDKVIRLFNKKHVTFGSNSTIVHETLEGYKETRVLSAGHLQHNTFNTKDEFDRKLTQYTTLAAEDMLRRGKNITWSKRIFSPIAAFIKWYFIKQGFKDGRVGWYCSVYAFRYTRLKYIKANRTFLR